MRFGGASYSVLDDILSSSDDEKYDDFVSMMPEPEPENESTSAKKARRRELTVKRTPTTDADAAKSEAIRLSTIASGLSHTSREKEIVLLHIHKDIFHPSQQILLKNKVLDFSKNNTVTLSQSLKNSGLIIVKIKFKSISTNSVFSSHLSFWPRISLPKASPSTFSQKNFEIFRKGNIHLKLDNYKSQIDNQPLTIKVSLNSTKNFVIPPEDFSAISEGDDTYYIKFFLNVLLTIINHEKYFLFPGILGAKRKSKSKTKRKRRSKSKQKRKKRSKSKQRSKKH